MKVKSSVIVVAAGRGSRMLSDTKKQFMFLGDKPVVDYSIEFFTRCSFLDEIVLVVAKEDVEYCEKIMGDKVSRVVEGGRTRQESVYNGLKNVNCKTDVVIIHDAARPFVGLLDLEKLVSSAYDCGSATFGVFVKDTVKLKDDNVRTLQTLDRDKLIAVQTPQAFRYSEILKAHEVAKEIGYCGTDDTSLIERCGGATEIVVGSYFNIKITTKEDLVFADAIRKAYLASNSNNSSTSIRGEMNC